MEFKQLEAFLHVAELGSFTRAATILDTNQPALSRMVRQLETELRHNLLTRNGRGVAMTDAGKILLAHARGIVQQVERAGQDLQDLRGKVTGHFSIGLLPSVSRMVASKLVRNFSDAYPEATISIAEGLSAYLLEWLMIGRIDMAVLYDTGFNSLIEKQELIEQELFLIGPYDAAIDTRIPLPFSKIGDYKLIMPSRLHGYRQSIESRAAELGLRLQIVIEIDAVPSILDLVEHGLGYAVLTENALISDPQKRKVNVYRFVKPTQTLRLVRVTARRHSLTRLAKQAIPLVERHVMEIYARIDPAKSIDGRSAAAAIQTIPAVKAVQSAKKPLAKTPKIKKPT